MRTFLLGRYNCVELLGAGPLGETYRAKIYGVAGFEKQFAVKRLHAQLSSDEGFVGRFIKAASRYAALEHERIARVHEVNTEGAQHYLVIDLVRGLDLRRLIDLLQQRGEALAPDICLLIACDIAEALAYTHGRKNLLPGGVPHLGLTANSVMVTYEGEARVLDIGLLAALIRPGWSDDDSLLPTLSYLAPEVLRGEHADGRADLFSLGAIIHELFSGTRAFSGDHVADLRSRIDRGPPPLPTADARLAQIVTRALQPDREQRFASADEMRAALDTALGGRATRARSELAALVRRMAAPRERRTGAFAAVTLAAAPPTPPVTPIATKPTVATAPTVQRVWSPPIKPATERASPTLAPVTSRAAAFVDEAETRPRPRIEPEPLPRVDIETVRVVRIDAEPESPSEAGATIDGNPRRAANVDEDATTHRVTLSPAAPVAAPNLPPPVAPPLPPIPALPVATAPTMALAFTPAAPEPPVVGSAPSSGLPFSETLPASIGMSPTAAMPAVSPPEPDMEAETLERLRPPIQPPTSELPALVPEAALTWTPPPSPSSALPSTKRRGPNSIVVLAVLSIVVIAGALVKIRSDRLRTASARSLPSVGTLTGTPAASPVGRLTNTPSGSPVEAVPIAAENAQPPKGTLEPVVAPPVAIAPAVARPSEAAAPVAIEAKPQAAKDAVVTSTREPAAAGGVEVVTSPPGAAVFVDGERLGLTPTRVRLTSGLHQLVISAERSKLVKRQISDDVGRVDLTLESAKLPSDIVGPASLKVRCKTRGELRIFVDGADSGLNCPNDQRIYVTPGEHRIGLYSPRTGEVHEVEHDITDGEHSTRVYVKY